MDSKQVTYKQPGLPVGSVLLALLIGATLPIVGLVQISLLVPTLMLGGIFAARLYAKNGWIPAGVLIVATAVSSGVLLGGTLALILVVASLLPAVAVIFGMTQKKPFFEQLNAGVAAFFGGLLAAILIANMSFGGGMISRFVNTLRAEYDRMPDALLQPMVNWVNTMLSSGVSGSSALMTVDSFRSQLSGVLDLMEQTYAQILPGALLSGALLSGVVSVLWGNWTMARQGRATNQSFVGMSGWFMPARISIGAIILWIAGLIMMYSDTRNGTTVYTTIAQAAGAAFAVQALCALDRRMVRADRPLGRRRLLIMLLAILALLLRGVASVLTWIGAASALFGSHGAIRMWLQNRQNDQSNHNDPNE